MIACREGPGRPSQLVRAELLILPIGTQWSTAPFARAPLPPRVRDGQCCLRCLTPARTPPAVLFYRVVSIHFWCNNALFIWIHLDRAAYTSRWVGFLWAIPSSWLVDWTDPPQRSQARKTEISAKETIGSNHIARPPSQHVTQREGHILNWTVGRLANL